MKARLRFIIAALVLVHLSLFGMAAFCQDDLHTTALPHSHSNQDDGTHSAFCRWSCQAISNTPSLTQSTSLLSAPDWNYENSITVSLQESTHLGLWFLSPRAPPRPIFLQHQEERQASQGVLRA